MVDIGAYGTEQDSSIFKNCKFGQLWVNDAAALNNPPNVALPGGQTMPIPHVLVADETFSLIPNIMTPYSGNRLDVRKRVFNYRYNLIVFVLIYLREEYSSLCFNQICILYIGSARQEVSSKMHSQFWIPNFM